MLNKQLQQVFFSKKKQIVAKNSNMIIKNSAMNDKANGDVSFFSEKNFGIDDKQSQNQKSKIDTNNYQGARVPNNNNNPDKNNKYNGEDSGMYGVMESSPKNLTQSRVELRDQNKKQNHVHAPGISKDGLLVPGYNKVISESNSKVFFSE